MTEKIELMSPLRLSSYRDDANNNQIFQWVVGEFESSQITKWESILDGSSAIVQDITNIELINEMYFTVIHNTTTGDSVLTMGDVPELTNNGKVVKGGDVVSFDVTADIFKLNSLIIYKNGVKLVKDLDVFFVEENKIRLTNRLQVGDVIIVDHIVGV